MKSIFRALRRFYSSFGLVEQSQVVASTAVVVAMVTIVSAHFFVGTKLDWLDFVSIVTVGIIGFVSVFFSLKYGRQLEEQRRELLALNTIADAVNHSVELNYVLQSALHKVIELLGAEFGWIYLIENNSLAPKHQHGTTIRFLPLGTSVTDERYAWIRHPCSKQEKPNKSEGLIPAALKEEGVQAWASIPLQRKGELAGVLILASRSYDKFREKQLNLLQAFGNQIGVALHNASLFEQVRESEKQYADLYEHSPDMYHSVNREGVVVSCNTTETEVLGYTKAEIIGKPLHRLYPPESAESVRLNLRKLFHAGEEIRGAEEVMRKKDGSLIDVSVNTSLVYDGDGKPVLARIVARDVTEKKKLEQGILHAQKIDSIGNLAGGVAHDFNNILASILGSASMMKRKLKHSHKWYPHVDLMETAARRGAALTRQLLTFARKNNVHVRPIDLNAVVHETLRFFEPSIPKSIHIKKKLFNGPVVVNGDDGQLQQALLNLCINARDAMPEGGTLTISTAPVELTHTETSPIPEAEPGSYVTLVVEDTGVGIPDGIQPKVFEPFFSTKDPTKGTGLGLSVVYGVVRSHGGFTTLESRVGVGTKLAIYLPRVTETQLIRRKRRPEKVVGGTERVLIIEDEEAVNIVSALMLKDLGYAVTTARNGQEAIDLITRTAYPFSLILLDMNMPQMGGKQAFQKIKELIPDARVLVCSGYSDGMVDDEEFLKRIDGFLQKPFSIEEIAMRVREVLDQPT